MKSRAGGLGVRIAMLRRTNGLSLRELAALTGVSRSMLSKLEHDLSSPTATVLGKLAEGLGVSISQLLGGPQRNSRRRAVLVPRSRQVVFREADTGLERRSLSPVGITATVDLVVNSLPPGKRSGVFPAHKRGVEEILVVTAGQLNLRLDSRQYKLKEGDSILYLADSEHQFENPSTDKPAIFYIAINSSGTR